MTYTNVGALIDGRDAPSKRALKAALADDLGRVEFYTTSAFGPAVSFTGGAIPQGAVLTVVGPNPYTKRSFYATVKVNERTGRVTLS